MKPLLFGAVLLSLGSVFWAAGERESELHPLVELVGDGTVPPNGCLPTACLETRRHPGGVVMLVRFTNGVGHAYCLWHEDGHFHASDWRGSVVLYPTRPGLAALAKSLPPPYGGLEVMDAEIRWKK